METFKYLFFTGIDCMDYHRPTPAALVGKFDGSEEERSAVLYKLKQELSDLCEVTTVSNPREMLSRRDELKEDKSYLFPLYLVHVDSFDSLSAIMEIYHFRVFRKRIQKKEAYFRIVSDADGLSPLLQEPIIVEPGKLKVRLEVLPFNEVRGYVRCLIENVLPVLKKRMITPLSGVEIYVQEVERQ